MSKPPKLDRKQLKQPDSFVSRGQNILGWFLDQRSRFLPVLVAALVLVAIGYGYDWYSSRRLDSAWKAYHEAMKLPEPQKWEDLKSVQSRYRNRASFFAAVTLADHFFSEAKKAALKDDAAAPATKEPSKDVVANAAPAMEWYTKALEFSELLPAEKQLLYVNRGNTQELLRKYDDALNDYRTATEYGGDAKAFALLNVGRAYELKNDQTKAVETYEKVTVDFASTEYAKSARNSIRRLKSPLFATPQALSPKAG